MVQAAEVLARVPQVPVVVDHLGSPYDTSPEGLATWHAGMAALAALPHVQVKLGGYAMFFRSDLRPVARDLTQAAVGMFGPERAMFASNFPVDRLHLRYADVETATAFYGL